MVRDRALPEFVPAYRGVFVSSSGGLWVEVWPEEPGTRLFDIFNSDWRYIESVSTPALLASHRPIYIADDAIYGVALDADTGLERVLRLQVQR